MAAPLKYFTGIGSRETSPELLQVARSLARKLVGERGYGLRTGEASGADWAFGAGGLEGFTKLAKTNPNVRLEDLVELYTPLSPSPARIQALHSQLRKVTRTPDIKNKKQLEELLSLLIENHPGNVPRRLSPKTGIPFAATTPKWKYHFRNPLQLLGGGLDKPSDFVLATLADEFYTGGVKRGVKLKPRDPALMGGTGQNLRIAMKKDIPVVVLNKQVAPEKRAKMLPRLMKSNPDIDWEALFNYLAAGYTK
tara:strand:+ start:1742 stop:2497 length:756 start_codon:yes stop_codon:yes gene_type:complete